MRRKILTIIIAGLMCVSSIPVSAMDLSNGSDAAVMQEGLVTVASGTCGDNLTWALDNEGTLTISGTGDMTDASSGIPWNSYRSDLKKVIIGDGVTSISDAAFQDCSSLTSVVIPAGVTRICPWTFAGCSSLTSIEIPAGVTSIDWYAFNGCSSLTSVVIPASVKTIDDHAFAGCSSLTSIEIPAGVTQIYTSMFYDCSSLKEIRVSSENTSYKSVDGVLCDYSGKKLLCYPAGRDASSYTIPDGVTTIRDYAFWGCSSLTSVVIPSGVTGICADAFTDCSSLRYVFYAGSEADWEAIVLSPYNGSLDSATIHYNATDHTWNEGEITTEPTTETEGVRTYTCTVCSETKTESIEKLEKTETPVEDVTSADYFHEPVLWKRKMASPAERHRRPLHRITSVREHKSYHSCGVQPVNRSRYSSKVNRILQSKYRIER